MNTDQVQQVINMVQTGLDTMSKSMGVALPHLWEVLVRQSMVGGIQSLVMSIICFLIVAVGIYLYVKHFKSLAEECYEALIVIPIILAILIITFVVSLTGGIGRLLNPEYYAIKEVVSYIKGEDR